jgi:hypothetical protein
MIVPYRIFFMFRTDIWRIFRIILSILHNIVMTLNNVMEINPTTPKTTKLRMDLRSSKALGYPANCKVLVHPTLPRVFASYMVRVYLEFVGQRSSRSKWLKNLLGVLYMSCIVAARICIFLTLQILPIFLW